MIKNIFPLSCLIACTISLSYGAQQDPNRVLQSANNFVELRAKHVANLSSIGFVTFILGIGCLASPLNPICIVPAKISTAVGVACGCGALVTAVQQPPAITIIQQPTVQTMIPTNPRLTRRNLNPHETGE